MPLGIGILRLHAKASEASSNYRIHLLSRTESFN